MSCKRPRLKKIEKRLAEKLKRKKEITNPYALAKWMVARGAKVK